MGLMMKNFSIMGVHWKIWFFFLGGGLGWERGAWKNNFFGGGELPKNGGLVKNKKRMSYVFEVEGGGWDPNVHYKLKEPSY